MATKWKFSMVHEIVAIPPPDAILSLRVWFILHLREHPFNLKGDYGFFFASRRSRIFVVAKYLFFSTKTTFFLKA